MVQTLSPLPSSPPKFPAKRVHQVVESLCRGERRNEELLTRPRAGEITLKRRRRDAAKRDAFDPLPIEVPMKVDDNEHAEHLFLFSPTR